MSDRKAGKSARLAKVDRRVGTDSDVLGISDPGISNRQKKRRGGASKRTRGESKKIRVEEQRPIVTVIGRKACIDALARLGIEAHHLAGVERGHIERDHHQSRLIVVQPAAVGREGVERAVRMLRANMPLTDVVLWSPDPKPEVVRAAFRGGARDAVFGPADDLAKAVAGILDKQRLMPRLERLDKTRRRKSRFERMVSKSGTMWDIFDLCVRVAPTDATVLILGDTGTGKELLARAIHKRSTRDGRWVAINCGAVPEQLIDSELFGHEKGAFTGATHSKRGLFRRADGGTLFLDEIGNIPLSAQYRLLRVLQEGKIRPVGGDEELPVDVRLIAATNAPLTQEVTEGRFREDLYYRLDVIRIEIPPLRERREDIYFLFGHFLAQFAKTYQIERPRVSDSFADAMISYDWPGNVRQLENFTEKLMLTHPGQPVDRSDFEALVDVDTGDAIADGTSGTGAEALPPHGQESIIDDWPLSAILERPLEDAAESFERHYLEERLRANRGRIEATAKEAGVSRRTLLRKLTRHGIDKMRFR